MQPGRAARPSSAGAFFAQFARSAAVATKQFSPLPSKHHPQGQEPLDGDEQTAEDHGAVRTVNDRRGVVKALPRLNDDSVDDVPVVTLPHAPAIASASPRLVDSGRVTAVLRHTPERPSPTSRARWPVFAALAWWRTHPKTAQEPVVAPVVLEP
jgi:hypothetical protein